MVVPLRGGAEGIRECAIDGDRLCVRSRMESVAEVGMGRVVRVPVKSRRDDKGRQERKTQHQRYHLPKHPLRLSHPKQRLGHHFEFRFGA